MDADEWDAQSTDDFRKRRKPYRKKKRSKPTSSKNRQRRGDGRSGSSSDGTRGQTCGTETRSVCRDRYGNFLAADSKRKDKRCSQEGVYVCRRSNGSFASFEEARTGLRVASWVALLGAAGWAVYAASRR